MSRRVFVIGVGLTTGLAQCAEAAGHRVDGTRVALQHSLGLGGAAVVTLYRRAAV